VEITIRDFTSGDHEWARALLAEHGGGTHRMARLGELVDPLTHEGLVAEEGGEPIGLLTVDESPHAIEVLTLHARRPARGAGSRLLATALQVAVASEVERLWLVTTNDNLDAIRFYLHRGMRVARVHDGAADADRATVKPEIPTHNPENGLPIRDYVEFELLTANGPLLPERRFPLAADLDLLPREAVMDALRPLFERAEVLVEPLANARPFGDDDGLIRAAHEIARELPEPAQIALLNAHPRIGADPAAVSALSRAEQGYDEADATPSWVGEELAMLNDAYERIFGFRFVIFVAGRPREEILPILERSLRDDRSGELIRGLDDVVYIAADRLAKLRAIETPRPEQEAALVS
jgi:2-oxo-4-hydroxy-4-carboxy--5-ureidoimidazoline (OHCU) decarboxylase/N-acetylglutamate synthase-like GNAT family acetyltransferase